MVVALVEVVDPAIPDVVAAFVEVEEVDEQDEEQAISPAPPQGVAPPEAAGRNPRGSEPEPVDS